MEAGAYAEFRDMEDHHWWFIGRKRIFGHLLQGLVAKNADGSKARILDIGCGMGGMLGSLAELGEVYGVDVDHDGLVNCRERGYLRVFRGMGQSLPFPDASLDLVCAFDTIEHIPEEMDVLAECRRILKPGGRLFISVPAYQWLYTHQDRLVHHQRRYRGSSLAGKLQRTGFRVRKLSYINFLLFPAILPAVLLIKFKQALRPPSMTDYASNVSIGLPKWANTLLAGIFAFERHLLRGNSVPIGHSLIAIAQKP